LQHLASLGVDVDKCVFHMSSDQSYTESQSPIWVWNEGTPEFDSSSLNDIHQRLSFSRNLRGPLMASPPSSRGQKQCCYGVSTLNMPERDQDTHTARPKYLKGTMDIADEFVKMSSAFACCGMDHPAYDHIGLSQLR